jgi:hypothetical protein
MDDAEADSRAAGARSVRLPAGSVEPVCDVDCAHPGPQYQQCWSTLLGERVSLAVRSFDVHLHSQLHRPSSWVSSSGRAGSSA